MLHILIAAVVLQPGDIVSWIIVGLIAGYLAGKVMRGRGFGCLGDIVVGLVGAFIGGFLASFLSNYVVLPYTYHFFGSIVIAFLGACILVAFLRLFSGDWGRADGRYRERYRRGDRY